MLFLESGPDCGPLFLDIFNPDKTDSEAAGLRAVGYYTVYMQSPVQPFVP